MKKTLYKTDQNHPVIKAYREAMQKGLSNYHVIYRGNEWWAVRADAKKPGQAFDTQEGAANYAQEAAQRMGTALFIHGTDGRIIDRRDYS